MVRTLVRLMPEGRMLCRDIVTSWGDAMGRRLCGQRLSTVLPSGTGEGNMKSTSAMRCVVYSCTPLCLSLTPLG